MESPEFEPTYRVGGDLSERTIVGGADDPHDIKKLILIVSASEERHSGDHLSEDTAAGPNVDRGAVSPRTQKDIGCSVPQRHYLRGIRRGKQIRDRSI